MSRWFRHYAGMMRDDKLVRVAIRSKQPIERVCWVWGAILESAAEIDDHGRYDVDAAEIAYFLRSDEADIQSIFDALSEAQRLADGCVVKWGNRQFSSDKSATRVAAHRQRKRAEKIGGNDAQNTGNVDVTLHGCSSNAPETETETETDNSVATATDASVVQNPAADFCKAVFDSGVSLLKKSGKSDAQARSIMGRIRKNLGDAEVLTLIRQSEIEGHSDPAAWLMAAVETRNGKRRSPANGYGPGEYRDPVLGDIYRDLASRLDQVEPT